MRAWLDRGDPGRGVGAVLSCHERGQRAGLACLLRRAGRCSLLGFAYRFDLVKAGSQDTAAVQGFVTGRPELPGVASAQRAAELPRQVMPRAGG
jgi:hypothetical protein